MPPLPSRRQFLGDTASIGAGFWIAGATAANRSMAANDKLNLGFIGVGGRGWSNLQSLAHQNVVALCDVDSARAAPAFERYPKAIKYRDFRRMLDTERSLDAVVISTPDHAHAAAALRAIGLDKHVYCEKPLVHDFAELKLLVDATAGSKVATQMGNQGTALSGLRQAVEFVRRGEIGPVREVHVWTNRPGDYWKQGLKTPSGSAAVPDTLDWDLWLGPAPRRSYDPIYVPFSWRGWWDFGTGALGDMGCHALNLPWQALRLASPSAIRAETSGPVGDCFPASSMVHFEFPARESLPPVRLTWYDGGRLPPAGVARGVKLPKTGAILIGGKRTLLSPGDYGARSVVLDGEKQKRIANSITGLETPRHFEEWVKACHGGPPCSANFPAVASLVELVLLGDIAVRVGEPLVWDHSRGRFSNHARANDYLSPTRRPGWFK